MRAAKLAIMPELEKTPMSRIGAERARLLALDPKRQAQLLDPAEQEFATHGFSGASLNRILAAAGMSKGQAYYYISSKADLYAAVIELAFKRLAEQMDIGRPVPETALQFWTYAEALLVRSTEVFLANPRLAALASGIYESGETRAAIASRSKSIRADLLEFVRLGQRLGAVRDDLPAPLLTSITFGTLAATDKWFAQNWPQLDRQQAQKLSHTVSALIKNALSPPKGDLQ